MRVTLFEKVNSVSQISVAPTTGAALAKSGVQASGICPSPANNPDVGSRPIQPAPGMYTSVQACRSVKSFSGPDGPSNDLISAVNCTRYPETNLAASPRC